MNYHHPYHLACPLFPWEGKNWHFQEDNDSYFINCQKSSKKEMMYCLDDHEGFPNFHLTCHSSWWHPISQKKYEWLTTSFLLRLFENQWHREPKAPFDWNPEGGGLKSPSPAWGMGLCISEFRLRKSKIFYNTQGNLLLRAPSGPLLWHSG